MKEERVDRANDVISYTVTKSLNDVGRENFWWLISLALLWGCHCFLAEVGKSVLVRVCVILIQKGFLETNKSPTTTTRKLNETATFPCFLLGACDLPSDVPGQANSIV